MNTQANNQASADTCTIEKALNVIGGKWSFLIVRQLFHGTKRYSELKRGINGVSSKSLTETLRHLEEHGVLTRKAFATVPPTVEYALTEKGDALRKVIHEMKVWGKDWI